MAGDVLVMWRQRLQSATETTQFLVISSSRQAETRLWDQAENEIGLVRGWSIVLAVIGKENRYCIAIQSA